MRTLERETRVARVRETLRHERFGAEAALGMAVPAVALADEIATVRIFVTVRAALERDALRVEGNPLVATCAAMAVVALDLHVCPAQRERRQLVVP